MTRKLSPAETMVELLGRWQRYWDLSDEDMGSRLGVSCTTWRRWLLRQTKFPHDKLVAAVNILKIPPDDALKILTGGCRLIEEDLERRRKREARLVG